MEVVEVGVDNEGDVGNTDAHYRVKRILREGLRKKPLECFRMRFLSRFFSVVVVRCHIDKRQQKRGGRFSKDRDSAGGGFGKCQFLVFLLLRGMWD